MKATDFKREHFANGRSFSPADFQAYIEASAQFGKAMYTRYLPCVAGGILVSFLFSKGIGGFAGNIMALLCIFGGLILGGVFNIKASKAVKEYAAKLGITNQDVAAARRHVKEGTVAWCASADGAEASWGQANAPAAGNRHCANCGFELREGAMFCPCCGVGASQAFQPGAFQPGAIQPEAIQPEAIQPEAIQPEAIQLGAIQPEAIQPEAIQPEAIQTEADLPEKPSRALWAAGLMTAAWFALVILQCVFGPRARTMGTAFNADALMMLVAALVGTGAYLITKPNLKIRLLGGGVGLAAALLNAWSVSIMSNPQIYSVKVGIFDLLFMQGVVFTRALSKGFLFALLALGAALAVSKLDRGDDKKRGARLCGLAAAGVYLACNLISTFTSPQMLLGSMQAVRVVSAALGAVADAATVYLIAVAIFALCNMKTQRVRLRGLGLVWAWLAAAGALVSLIGAISAGTSGNNGVITYTAQFVLAISALTGYILLLCKKRVGLYVVVIGVGVMLGAQAMGALNGVLYQVKMYLMMLISYLLGGVNPLFAYLAVRAGSNAAASLPVPCAPAEKKISGFQKAAAAVCLAAGGAGVAFPLVTVMCGERFVGGMAVYMLISAAFAAMGAILLIWQRSAVKAYGKGMRIFGGVAFGFGTALLLLSLGGIIAFLAV